MKTEGSRVYGYLRRLRLVSALATGFGMTASVSPGGVPHDTQDSDLLAAPFKTTADDLVAHAPIAFLRQLQRAVESDKAPPASPTNRLYGTGSTACSPTEV
jgi:hypothetical protein